MPNPAKSGINPLDDPADSHPIEQDELIDLGDIFRRLVRGFRQILGFALLGLVIAATAYLGISHNIPVTTSTQVVFSFPGFGNGQYPDGGKFTTNDLSAPDVVADALKSKGFDTSSAFLSKIRASLNIEGIIPIEIVRARDRARSLGQSPPTYVPEEYAVTLALPRSFPLSRQQRGTLLNAIVDAYREKFNRTYVNVPLAFGNAFESLRDADLFEYEIILNGEIQRITAFLKQQIEVAKNFRAPTTNCSFSDLLNQSDLFREIRLNATLGLIRQNGLSSNRALAMTKMDYYLGTLDDQERKALEEEKTVQDLLAKVQEHVQSYVLGIKSQLAQPRSEALTVDQGLIDSLLANDSYNFLVRKALDAGLEVKRIQASKAELVERRKNMETFLHGSDLDQTAAIAQASKSLGELKVAYDDLIKNIRQTQFEFGQQQFSDTIRLSDSIRTAGTLKPLAETSAIGLFFGAALGMGMSLLGIYLGGKKA